MQPAQDGWGGPTPASPPLARFSASTTHADDRSGPASAPPHFRRYRILGELGRGGMGVVYRAFDPDLEREVALKVLLTRDRARDPQGDVRWRRFRLEAEALARLDHPHVVRVHEVGEEQDVAFLVMALVEGQTLERRIDEGGPLPPREAARIVEALASALDALHREGILHRDIKPANVVLTPDGRPVLMDFGLARVSDTSLEQLTATGQFVGTPCYMPPEQAAGRPDVDRRADVYSLGATLFELLTGDPPCTGETLVQVLHAIQHEPPPRPSRSNHAVDPDLDTICLRCLAKAPASRYACAADLGRDLAAYLAGRPLEVARASLLSRLGAWPRRRPWSAAGLALASVGLTAALVAAIPAPEPTAPANAPTATPVAPTPRPAVASLAPTPAPRPTAISEAARRALEVARVKAAAGVLDDAVVQYEFVLRALARDEHPLGATVRGELAPLLAGRALSRAFTDPERAVADATRAGELVPGIPIDPSVLESFRILAMRANARGDRALTRALLDQAIAAGSSDGAHHDRGALRHEDGDLVGAFQDYARALEINPRRVVDYEREGLIGNGTQVQVARGLLARGRRPGRGAAPLTEGERQALEGFLHAVERARALQR